jgi:PAS domain S-box-containing protein
MTVLDQKRVAPGARLRVHQSPHPVGSPTLVRLLAESTLHRAIFDACSVPIALIDLRSDGLPVALVNPAFESFLGCKASEAQNRPFADMLHDTSMEAARKLLVAPASRVLLGVLRCDGGRLPCEVTAGHVRGGDGELSYAVLAFARRGGQDDKAQTALTVSTGATA